MVNVLVSDKNRADRLHTQSVRFHSKLDLLAVSARIDQHAFGGGAYVVTVSLASAEKRYYPRHNLIPSLV